MRKLISTLLLTGIVLFPHINSFAQTRDSLIQLYPGIGDTIFLFDRDYFKLFPKIGGFEYAVFYIRDNKELVSIVTYNSGSVVRDTLSTYSLSALENIRLKIRKISNENYEKLEPPREVMIFTKEANQYTGLLEMFSKENLYLISSGQSDDRFKIPISKVDSILIPGESRVASSMGWGALIGFCVGGLLGIASGDDKGGFVNFSAGKKALGFGGLLGGVGAIIGLVVGLSSSENEEVIQIDKDFDLHQLKNIAYYYFVYNETREKKYIEIK